MSIDFYSEEELAIAKDLIFALNIGTHNDYRSETPVGVLLGGQPASGKTGLIRYTKQTYNHVKFVVINGDEYRQYHPRFRQINEVYGADASLHTQPFSNALVEHLKAECLRLRYNFIIEGTMRTFVVIQRTVNEIKQAGFRCEAHVLAVSRQDSLLAIFQRFEGDKQRTGIGRLSPIEVHDEAYQQLPVNLTQAFRQHLFDRMVIYVRETNRIIPRISITETDTEIVDFLVEFERLRIPLFDKAFYRDQWLAIRTSANQRGETDATYLRQLDTCIWLNSQ